MVGSGDRTRSHSLRDTESDRGRVVAFWDGGISSKPLDPGARIVIGRADESDLQIMHASVSRRHAELEVGPPATLSDLGSSNGVRVNGHVFRKGERAIVGAGDVIEIGAAVLVVQAAATPRVAPVATEDPMVRTRKLVQLVAKSSLSVLLQGETGSGKEVTAESIHRLSPRGAGPFLRVNCAAFTESLLESELFGHVKGAFTGAVAARRGLIEAADGGTLFLDEVGEIPLATQPKLLRVLESREVRPVGDVNTRIVDVRFIAATNRELEHMVEVGSFRRDLYFRLNGVTVVVPPLRERRGEIPELARRFLGEAAERERLPLPKITDAAIAALVSHDWPGNVRELKNVIERAFLFSEGQPVLPEHLQVGNAESMDLTADVARLERDRVVNALARANGNQTAAAKLLGISRRTLIHRLEKFDLPRPRRDSREDES